MKRIIFAGLASLLVLTTSCEKKDNSSDEGNGKLKVSITDSPFPFELIQSASVTIVKGEVKAADVNGNEEASFLTFFEDSATFNLMDLRNGITDELTVADIPAGSYDEVRLVISSASITLVNGQTYDLKIPSGSSSGLKVKIDPSIDVNGGLTSELVLDFDVSKSFVLKGNMKTPAGINGFNFKPVIRAVNTSSSGRLQGMVTDTTDMAVAGVSVWLEQDTVVASALSDTTGYYKIIALPEGEYDVYATKPGFDTVSVQGIMINAANSTQQDFTLTPSSQTK
ncbi:MAG TPA: DUF4382 domain-containing protein [Bacteroidales bacterium]|nr:DUF4382 domain-containing protein [Bacteroidales bacterium]